MITQQNDCVDGSEIDEHIWGIGVMAAATHLKCVDIYRTDSNSVSPTTPYGAYDIFQHHIFMGLGTRRSLAPNQAI